MRNISLSNREIYHIYNRGVDKRNIFLGERGYKRFADSLIVFNNKKNLNGRNFNDPENFEHEKSLVNVIAYCLMPNHFHLLIRQNGDVKISKLMQKLCTGYAKYFQKK